MDSYNIGNLEIEIKHMPILYWIIAICGVTLLLPSGILFFIIGLVIFDSPQEGYSTGGILLIIWGSGLVFFIGLLLLSFGIRQIRSHRKARAENDILKGANMFYKVVHAENMSNLTKLVEDLLHQGWILAGGITFDGNFYLQAMTRS